MKTKKVMTANLQPGMVSAEAAYTFTNHLVIQSNTQLTLDVIEKLKYYGVRSVKVYDAEETTEASAQDTGKPTYFERIQQTKEFVSFKQEFTNSAGNLSASLHTLADDKDTGVIAQMLLAVNKILEDIRNPLHLLDMLHCMRDFDDMTYTHSLNVALLCHIIGSWLSLPPQEMNVLITAGLLHDIGKLKIPQEIITKPGKLTDEEFEQIRSHPKLGYDLLRDLKLDNRIKLAALQHHERYDGSGYPRHLSGEEIDRFSAIVAIADVYDAMTSNRVYRKGICPFTVIATFEQEKDLYDPEILYLFMKRTIEAYINTEVILSNGETGKVVLMNQTILSRPVVITDTKSYDLSRDFSVDIVSLK